VAKIDEVKAQRLRALAPPNLIIERDSFLACADYQSGTRRVPPIGHCCHCAPSRPISHSCDR